MEKITDEMRKALNATLPSEAITKHPTKTYLSSIKAIYVTERLNDVFGVGSWRTKVEKESVNDNGMVVVKLIFEIPNYGVYYESFGGNDNGGEASRNFDLGDAYKGATTDALTKICSFLEIGIDVFKGKGNTPVAKAPFKPSTGISTNKTLTQRDIEKWNGKIYKNNLVYIDNVPFNIPSEQIEKLKLLPNYKKD